MIKHLILNWFCKHDWTEWEFHPGYGEQDWETRYCKKCGKIEERDC